MWSAEFGVVKDYAFWQPSINDRRRSAPPGGEAEPRCFAA